jgi:hypothetical protein
MTKKLSSARNSVQTDGNVNSSSRKETPFQKGSVRELVYLFLKKARTYQQFASFCREEGVSPQNTLRFLRNKNLLREENGRIQVA